ncbi:unnamed protein product, partial [Ixodes hexagonus]
DAELSLSVDDPQVMEEIRKRLNLKISDALGRPCSANGTTDCSLLDDSSSWNEVLHPVGFELYEYEPGHFALKSLNTHLEELGDDGARALAEVLKTDAWIEDLELSGNDIGSIGARALAEAITVNHTLKKLNLTQNYIDTLGTIAIAKSLLGNTTLEEVNLGYVLCEDSELEGLEPMFESLGLQMSDLESDCLVNLFRKLGSFERIIAVWNDAGVSELARTIQCSDSIRKVSLEGLCEVSAEIQKELFGALLANKTVETLEIPLEMTCSEDAVCVLADYLSTTTSLKHFTMPLKVTQEQAIKALTEALAVNRSIVHLQVICPDVDVLTEQLFGEVFRQNRTIETFLLNDYTGQFESSKHEPLTKLAAALADNYVVTKVKNKFSWVPWQGLSAMHRVLRRNGSLLNRAVSMKTREDRELELFKFQMRDALRRNLTLFHRALKFVLGCNEKCMAAAFEKVCGSEALVAKVMELEGDTEPEAKQRIKCRDAYLRTHFFQITLVVSNRLECVRTGTMDYGDCNLISEHELEMYAHSIASLDALRVLKSITSLRDKLKAQGVDLLKTCVTRDDGTSCWIIDSLPILNKHLTAVHTELEEFEPGKLAVTYIDVGDECDDISDRNFSDCIFLICWLLRYHRCFKRVCLCESVLLRTNPAMLGTAIELAPGLVEVDIKSRFISARASTVLAAALSHKVGLEKMHLSSLLVDHATARDIACALKKSRVRSLVLYNGLSTRAGDMILRAVGQCSHLTSLVIDGYEHFLVSNAKCLANVLAKTTTITKLSVTGTCSSAVKVILTSLQKNTSVRELSLVCQHPSRSVAMEGEELEPLASNSVLKKLTLSLQELDDAGAIFLSKWLKDSVTLEELDLSWSSVRVNGALVLAEALKTNRTLKKFVLDNYGFTSSVVEKFVEALKLNQVVESVRLGTISIPEEVAYQVANNGHNVCRRLEVTWNTDGLLQLARELRDDRGSGHQLYLGWSEDASESSILEVFLALSRNTTITELYMQNGSLLNVALAQGLERLLRTTKTLKKLEIDTEIQVDRVVLLILSGLANNSTVNEVVFCYTVMSSRIAKAVGEMLQANRTIHTICFQSQYLNYGVQKKLARCLRNNHVLVKFDFSNPTSHYKGLFTIREIVLRNRCLLNRAAQFVLKTASDQKSLDAFQLVCRNESLVEHLVKITGQSEVDVRKSIAATLDCAGLSCDS